jgi:hypothetical protein
VGIGRSDVPVDGARNAQPIQGFLLGVGGLSEFSSGPDDFEPGLGFVDGSLRRGERQVELEYFLFGFRCLEKFYKNTSPIGPFMPRFTSGRLAGY